MNYPIADLHCDLLMYLAHVPEARITATENIGATLPYLQQGNVKLQVMAIFTPTRKGSVAFGEAQLKSFLQLVERDEFYNFNQAILADRFEEESRIGACLAIENASNLCDETEAIENALTRLDDMLEQLGQIFYISLTHNDENRFGGGNFSDNVGLKADGERLLRHMNGKKIAIDLAHTSDQLAHDILQLIDKEQLDIPVVASHSNFRTLFDHVRNLPDELVEEVKKRNGLMGMNFLRMVVHPDDPSYLIKHISKGMNTLPEQVAYGADFFYRKGITKPERQPLFFEEHEDAGKYPSVTEAVAATGFSETQLKKLCYQNVLDFIKRNW